MINNFITLLKLKAESATIMVRFIWEMHKIKDMPIKEKWSWVREASKTKRHIRKVAKAARKNDLTVEHGDNLDKLNKIRDLYQKEGESDAEYRERIQRGILNGEI